MYYKRYRLEQLYVNGEPQNVYRETTQLFDEGWYDSIEECQGWGDGDIIIVVWEVVDGYICELNSDGTYRSFYKLQKMYSNGEPYIPEEFKKGEEFDCCYESLYDCEEDIIWKLEEDMFICVEDETKGCINIKMKNKIDSGFNIRINTVKVGSNSFYTIKQNVKITETEEKVCTNDPLTSLKGCIDIREELIDNLEYIDFSDLPLENVIDFSNFVDSDVFIPCDKVKGFERIGKGNNIIDSRYMFAYYQCANLPEFEGRNIKEAEFMFQTYSSVLDLPKFDGENIKSARGMFRECKLNNIYLPSFKGTSIDNMNQMFYDATTLTKIDLPEFNAQVTTMDYLFDGCENLIEINMPKFRGAQNCYSNYVFNNCNKLEKVVFTSLTNIIGNHAFGEVKDRLIELLSDCKNIKYLDLHSFVGSGGMVDDDIINLNNFPNLEWLDISSIFSYRKMAFREPVWTNLSKLNFVRCKSKIKELIQNSINTELTPNLAEGGSCVWEISE